MKPQPTPLYAITRDGSFVQVIGWTETTSQPRVPVAVPLGKFGQPAVHRDDLCYLAQAPDLTHELNQLQPSPSAAETAIIQRNPNLSPVLPRNGWDR
jgi:hypothetical protein